MTTVKIQKGFSEKIKTRLKSDLIREKRKQNSKGERWVRGSELDFVHRNGCLENLNCSRVGFSEVEGHGENGNSYA